MFAVPATAVEVRFVRFASIGRKCLSSSVQCTVPIFTGAACLPGTVTTDRVGDLRAAILTACKVADVLAAHSRPPAGMDLRVCFDVRGVTLMLAPAELERLGRYSGDEGGDGLLVVLLRLIHSRDIATEWREIRAGSRESTAEFRL